MTKISVLRDVTKIWKKSPISKMSKTFILHNNDAENLLNHWYKTFFNNRVTYLFYISEFIDCPDFIYIFLRFLKNVKTLRLYKCVTVSSISRKICGYYMKSCYKNISEIRNDTVLFKNVEKNWQNSYWFWKIYKFIKKDEKR